MAYFQYPIATNNIFFEYFAIIKSALVLTINGTVLQMTDAYLVMYTHAHRNSVQMGIPNSVNLRPPAK